jgi:LacI family transcriptional regulator
MAPIEKRVSPKPAKDRPERATLRDVARAVGVHPSTASRAMDPRTSSLLTPEIVARVQQSAAALGYRPNQLAAGLRTQRSNAIGVMIPDITNPVFPPILLGIEDGLSDKGYISIVANAGEDPARQHDILDRMMARRVDGMILATVAQPDPVVRDCIAAGLPLVLINRGEAEGIASSVVNDDVKGMQLAVAHVVSLGHRRIAHIAGPQNLSTGDWRRRGFLDAMAAAGLAIDPRLIVVASRYSREAGHAACAALLAAKPTAIIAANDLLALGCYDALREAGLACPRDLSITGFNDMPLVDMVAPPLTTIRIRHHEMGYEAALLLLRKIDGSAQGETEILLPPELIVRCSTAPPS